MFAITGKVRAITPFSIPVSDREVLLYPRGYHLRGAVGYAAIELNLSKEFQGIFPDWNREDVLFFDLIPYCRCNEKRLMLFNTFCGECKLDLNSLVKKSRTRRLSRLEVAEGLFYRLKIVVLNDNYLDEVIKVMNYFRKTGLRIGRGRSSGYGLFEVNDFTVEKVRPFQISSDGSSEAKKVRLVSDAVVDEEILSELKLRSGLKTKVVTLSRTVVSENKFETRKFEVIPRGEVIELNPRIKFNGFAVGKFTSLGFGEVMPVQK